MTRKPTTEARAQTGRGARKVREGVVLSSKMDRTAVIAVVDRVRHPKYAKFVLRTRSSTCTTRPTTSTRAIGSGSWRRGRCRS
jgi:ribosomal protein S17